VTRVAAIQMVSSADVGLNLDGASRLLREARAQGARVAALPENFAFMGVAEADKFAIAENDGDGPIQSRVASLASELGLWIVAGTIPLHVPGETRLAAACLVYDSAGRRKARYDKIHLFDVGIPGKDERYQESSSVRPGATPVCVDTPVGRLGLAVCYDCAGATTWHRFSIARARSRTSQCARPVGAVKAEGRQNHSAPRLKRRRNSSGNLKS
jgi:deaminated glutathione amidase